MDVRVVREEEVYRGFFRLSRVELQYRRFDGAMSPVVAWECVDRGEAVVVILYDPGRDRLGMIRQFRLGSHLAGGNGWMVEFVAGACQGETDYPAVARREVWEETGVIPRELRPIFPYFLSPSGSTERIHLFLGLFDSEVVPEGGGGLDHEGEDVQFFTLSFDQAWALHGQGAINSATVILALQWLALNRDALRDAAN